MSNNVLEQSTLVNLPVSLEQLAVGLRKLSRADLLTLEILLDKKTMATISRSLKEVKSGKIKELTI